MNVPEQIRRFFISYPLRHYHKGELLILAEETPAGIFYLVEGAVNEYDIATNGNEVVVNVFKPGAFFPMSWALNHIPNDYFFAASTSVTTRVAPPEKVVDFLRDNADVQLDLLSRVYRGTDGILRRMAHLMGGDADSRLIFELLNAAYRFGEQQPDGTTLVPLHEGDLATHSGLARETINRIMQRLKAANLVEVHRSGIRINDIAKLEAVLGNIV